MNTLATQKTLREENCPLGEVTLHYRLSAEESEQVASFGLSLYSVTVKMDRDGKTTETSLCNCFSKLSEAVRFFDFIMLHRVTPIDLPYVFEDMSAE